MAENNQSVPEFVVAQGALPDGHRLRGAVVAIGNFDGVHRGHQAVIATAQRRAAERDRPTAALTFEPHPRSFFRPQVPLFRLTDAHNKLRLLASTGLDGAIVLPFDAALAELSADDFVHRILIDHLAIAGVTIGFDFHFGARRSGTADFLTTAGARNGFSVDVVPRFEDNGRRISSGPIRVALADGQVADAAEMLGFPWFVTGEVVHGDKRGRELGYPTANLRLDPNCRLRHGIYAVRVNVAGTRYNGVANFGRRPMFDIGTVLLEIFLFEFSGDLYGQSIDAAFIEWIRPEMKFDSLDDLVRRMDEDSRIARQALAKAPNAFPPLT
jgi:riboflavin kinase / FMN adenylyltransferase